MRLRIVGLLVVAGACAWLAATVSATSREETARAAPPARPVHAPARRCPLPRPYRTAFKRAARATGVPLALLVALARVESKARPRAHALGLGTSQPPSNVLAHARYLRLMLDRFHSADLALAAYEAGPTAVARAGGAPNAATLAYVAAVTRAWRRLHRCR
jgi:soluble lytic murein transglycosylase-like protein